MIRVLQDFEAGVPLKHTPGVAIAAAASSETEFGKTCLKVVVEEGFRWNWKGPKGNQELSLDAVQLSVVSGPYIPPEADAIRAKVKISSGHAIVAIGGPVSQLGNSDVWCDPQLVEAGKNTEWQTLEFSLNERIVRNFRRANFTRDLPVHYYTPWVQEPIYLYLVALPRELQPQGKTTLLIDQVELIAKGQGKPFPKFDESQIKVIETIADFERDSDLSRVCSVAHGYSLIKSFEYGYRREGESGDRPVPEYVKKGSPFIQEEGIQYPAPRYTRVPSKQGKMALQAECAWAEEGQIITLKTTGNPHANALKFTIKPNYPKLHNDIYKFDHEGRPGHVVDFIVFVSPNGTDFPWSNLGPNDELTQVFRQREYRGPGAKYDYLLTTDRQNGSKVSNIEQAGAFGFYFARRHMTANEWSTVIIPFADFICVYGQGTCRDLQQKQVMLAPSSVAAIGCLAPFGTGHGTIAVDDVSFVSVPGTHEELRSYWQVPDINKVRRISLPRYRTYGAWSMMTLGEDAPAFLK